MAETVHLNLKASGNDIYGESTQTSLGRENTIECIFFDYSVHTGKAGSSGLATGKRQYSPIVIRKRIDKSTPLLLKALTENQVVEGSFLFYRPNQAGDGTTEQYFTIEIKKAKIASIRNWVPNTLSPESSNLPALEELSFVFGSISITYTNGGISHEDSISTRTAS